MTPAMLSTPGRAYAALVRALEGLGPATLFPDELQLMRDAADARLFADADRDDLTDAVHELLRRLVDAGRLSTHRAEELEQLLEEITAAA